MAAKDLTSKSYLLNGRTRNSFLPRLDFKDTDTATFFHYFVSRWNKWLESRFSMDYGCGKLDVAIIFGRGLVIYINDVSRYAFGATDAVIHIAEEMKHPDRDVPCAMYVYITSPLLFLY